MKMDSYDKKSNEYRVSLERYTRIMKTFSLSKNYEHAIESSFESFNDWSLFYTLDEIKEWFASKRKNSSLKVEEIGVNELDHWNIDKNTGNIYHDSNDFFIIRGIRVKISNREVSTGWDQPICEQIGYDGGLLGIIRKRFHGVPHYLCESKIEPGNYGDVQISPTLQATFANLNKKHNGRKPYFSEYFDGSLSMDGTRILFDAWLAEDGGRLYKKRNRGILLELPESSDLKLPNDNFCWFSLYQLKQLLTEDSWVNPHVRGIIVHI